MSSIRSFSSTLLLALLPLGFLIVMVVAPLVALAFYDGSAWGGVLRDDYMQHLILWTVFQALATCVLAGILGVPAAWVLARLDFRGRALVLRLLMLPFVMPTLVAGMGVLALFGTNGAVWAGWQDTPYLLIYGNVFFNLPVLVRAAYQGFLQVPEAQPANGAGFGGGGLAAVFKGGMAGYCARGWRAVCVWFSCIVFRGSDWLCCWAATAMRRWK